MSDIDIERAVLVGSESLWQRGHPQGHPLRPERLRDTWEMLHAYRAFDAPNTLIVPPRYPDDADLHTFHTHDYVEVVRRLSRGQHHARARQHNFGEGDNPIFEGMFESESLKVGAALVGADLLVRQRANRVFSYGGGLHHAHADRASGFCIFGDGVIAINHLLDHDLRVAYIDIDAHHGDGVQDAFYAEPDVLTISIHESGDYLFPGTGHVHELGDGPGRGYSVNIPLAPHTDDDGALWAFDQIVPPLMDWFAPDVVVAQFGVDAHWRDPLTHLAMTTRGLEALFDRIVACSPRLLAVGGGGYDRTVVPRAWTLAWGALSGQRFPNALPAAVAGAYDPPLLHDADPAPVSPAERAWAQAENERTVAELHRLLPPLRRY